MSERQAWKTHYGFIFAALGAAIGLGNIWRFPYIAYRNGGGAFLVPYLVALLVVGIPLLILEFGLGHYARKSFPAALGSINRGFSWLGWWAVIYVMFGIVVYYAVVIAWSGNYVVFSLSQPWETSANVDTFFDETFTGAVEGGRPFQIYRASTDGGQSSGFFLGRINIWIIISLAVVWLVNWLITRRDLQKGIELASKLFIPTLVALVAVLVIWSWNFEGAAAGRWIYLNPDWSQVFRPQPWIDAFTQIFFSIGIGLGIMVAYASYLPRNTDLPAAAFLTAVGNSAFSLFAGFAVFAAIGMLAHGQDLDLTENRSLRKEHEVLGQRIADVDPQLTQQELARAQELSLKVAEIDSFESRMQTFGLLFKTYPAIITEMGPVTGRLFGVLFFVALMVAGISSSISIIEAFGSALYDQFGWSRRVTSSSLCLIGFVMGIVLCTQAGVYLLDLVDHFITTYGIVVVAIGEALIVGWMLPAKKLREHMEHYRRWRFGRTLDLVMRLFITLVLLVTWFGLTQANVGAVVSAVGRLIVIASAIVLWFERNWLDFDIRIGIPILLVFLLDQALIADLSAPYGGYPMPAIWIVAGWLALTMLGGIALALIPSRSKTDQQRE